MAGFGVSFAPTGEPGGDPMGQGGGGIGGAPVSPLQRAIQLLSLRLPRFGGQGLTPGSLAPNALLGGGGMGGGSGLGDLLARLLQGQGGGGIGGGMSPAFPTPNIIPGERGEPKMIDPGEPEPIIRGIVPPGSFQPSGPRQPPAGFSAPGGMPRQPRFRGGY